MCSAVFGIGSFPGGQLVDFRSPGQNQWAEKPKRSRQGDHPPGLVGPVEALRKGNLKGTYGRVKQEAGQSRCRLFAKVVNERCGVAVVQIVEGRGLRNRTGTM